MESQKEPSASRRYLLALLAPALVAGVMQLTWPFFEPSPTSLYLLAVMIASWYGGLGPGLLSVLISCLLADYFFIEPFLSLRIARREDLIGLGILALVGPLISVMSELMQRERRRAEIKLDITKGAEEALRRSEVELADFFENAAMGLHWVGPDGTILRINQAELDFLGYGRDECIGHHIAEFHADSDVIEDILERLQAGEILRDYEARLRCKDDSIRYVHINSSVYWEEGKFVHTRCFIRDITERKRAEAALQESERRFREMLENVELIAVVLDVEGRVVFCNDHLLRLTERKRADVLGQNWFALFVPPELHVEDVFKSGIEQGTIPAHFENDILTATGERRCVSWNNTVLRDIEGRVVGTTSIGEDITERKHAEQVEKELHQRIRDILENIGDGFVAINREWRFTYANRRAGKMLERRPEDLVGKEVWTEFSDSLGGGGYLACQRVMNERVAVEVEYYSRPMDRWFQNFSYPTPEGIAVCFRDVTEQKRAETALRESEKRFRLIAETITEVFWIADVDIQTMAYVSPAYERIWGRSRESLYKFPRSFLDAIHAEDRERVLADLELKKASQPFDHEYRIIRPDGAVRWIWDRGFPVKNEGQEVTHFVGIAQDITERKQAEKALRQAEQKYKNIVENAVEGIFQTTRDGCFITANPALANMLGFESPAELIASRTNIEQQHYVQPEHRAEFKRLLDQHDTVRGFEYEAYRKDGTKVWMSDNVRAVRDASGKLLYYEGSVEDITERKRAEEARIRLASIVESSDDAIIGKTLGGEIVSWNSGAERIYGYSAEEVIGRSIDILVPPGRPDEVPQTLERLGRGESINHYETVRRRRDGKLIDVSLTISPIKDATGRIVAASAIARDITESKQTQKALQTFSRRLIEAQEAERRRISRELHDQIGQVLTAVKINLRTLRQKCAAPDALSCIEDNLKVIDEAFEQVKNLSADLRPLLLDDFGLIVALRWYLERQTKSAGIRGEFVSLSLDEDERFASELETACFRIVQEAVTNIIRHAEARQITVRLERKGPDLVLSIKDDGVGFDLKALRNSTAGAATLGVRGMEERAQAVGGTMTINSAPGKGTEICAQFSMREHHRTMNRSDDTRANSAKQK